MAPIIAPPLFVVSLAVTLSAAATFARRLDQLGAKFGLPEVIIGLLTALAADGPEVSSALAALSKGAHEAGVVYFIDRALKTFASDTRPVYETGLADVAKMTAELFPGVRTISDATPEQQQQIVAELMSEMNPRPGPRRSTVALNADFPQTIWIHTLWGFLLDPEAGANRDYVGWKVIGRDPAHSFSPPFGFYDQDYPGWQASSPETDKR